jgi:hypothetical protein
VVMGPGVRRDDDRPETKMARKSRHFSKMHSKRGS